MRYCLIILLIVNAAVLPAQISLDFSGQSSSLLNYQLRADKPFLYASQNIITGDYSYRIDSLRKWTLHTSGNFNILIDDDFGWRDISFDFNSYRFWLRYTTKRMEWRLGLQKIEFGSASILRPLQWFNQIDPRDPLQLTNGVWGVLGRYYFKNNANIWLWSLYDNEGLKGFEFYESLPTVPEFGGRFQYPIPKGEWAVSYHHRKASVSIPTKSTIESRENRIGMDVKWDLGLGLWIEAMHVWMNEEIGPLRHSSFVTLGSDYTFGIGKGLNVSMEYMFLNFQDSFLGSGTSNHFVAVLLNYPFSLFDQLSCFANYGIGTDVFSIFLNYEHQFSKIRLFGMLFYNSSDYSGINQNELVYNFSGPGARIMAVYNF